MSFPARLRAVPAVRVFSSAQRILKKNIIRQSGRLGESLLKGEVLASDPQPQEPPEPLEPSPSALQECAERHRADLEDNYATIVHMSEDDIRIQRNFARGLQWGGHTPRHFFDRAAAYRAVPAGADLLTTPWTELLRVYTTLELLDTDKELFERALKLANGRMTAGNDRARQEKKFFQSCRNLRRGVAPRAPSVADQILAVLPYNVVGFDLTVLGFPLGGAKAVDADGKRLWPQDLIEDLRPFDTALSFRKEYVNIVDLDVVKNCVEPQYAPAERVKDALSVIGRPVFVENVADYTSIGPQLLQLVDVICAEIKHLQRSLVADQNAKRPPADERSAADVSTGPELDLVSLLSRATEFPVIKTGTHILASRHEDATVQNGPQFHYFIRWFDMVPFFGMNLVTRKQHHLFYRHIFKMFLVNCEPQIELLTRLKYKLPTGVRTFLRRLYGRIHTAIKNKVLPVALQHRCVYLLRFDAVVHQPMRGSGFLRLYWIKKPRGRSWGHRRQSQKLLIFHVE